VPTTTEVRKVHLTELRSAVDAFRAAVGLGSYSWTTPSITAQVTQIDAVHVNELRTALNLARAYVGLAALSFTDSLTPSVTEIKVFTSKS
jgi:hypothetical protein